MGQNSIKLPDGYGALLQDLKERIQSAQLKATVAFNRELVLPYWDLGARIIAHFVPSAISYIFGETRQPLLGCGERGFLLAKRKADLRRAVAGIVVEARPRDHGNTNLLHEKLCERDIVRETEA